MSKEKKDCKEQNMEGAGWSQFFSSHMIGIFRIKRKSGIRATGFH